MVGRNSEIWALFCSNPVQYSCSCIHSSRRTTAVEADREHATNIIRKKYCRLALKRHPDKGGCEEAFKRLSNAREMLDDWITRGDMPVRMMQGAMAIATVGKMAGTVEVTRHTRRQARRRTGGSSSSRSSSSSSSSREKTGEGNREQPGSGANGDGGVALCHRRALAPARTGTGERSGKGGPDPRTRSYEGNRVEGL